MKVDPIDRHEELEWSVPDQRCPRISEAPSIRATKPLVLDVLHPDLATTGALVSPWFDKTIRMVPCNHSSLRNRLPRYIANMLPAFSSTSLVKVQLGHHNNTDIRQNKPQIAQRTG